MYQPTLRRVGVGGPLGAEHVVAVHACVDSTDLGVVLAHSLAVTARGRVFAWGVVDYGCLGFGVRPEMPAQVPSRRTVPRSARAARRHRARQ